MHAAGNGHFSTVRCLLKRGADARATALQVESPYARCDGAVYVVLT